MIPMKRLFLAASAMLLAAAPALAAAPGDIVRASWTDPYMLGSASTRMVFPDQKTFETWGSPSASVVDAPQLSQWTLAGALPVREGSKLVKFGTDPQVYAVGPHGALHWITTEALAAQLYGSGWDRNVVTLFPSFYPNYTLASPVLGPSHPDGTLIKYPDAPTVYYLIHGVARPFADEQAFKANDFNFSSVLTIPKTFTYVRGNPIDVWEQDLNPMLKSS